MSHMKSDRPLEVRITVLFRNGTPLGVDPEIFFEGTHNIKDVVFVNNGL